MIVAIIILITAAISIMCFQDRANFYKLAYSTQRIRTHREYYRLISHMFVHGDWMHLIVNMFVLFSFAPSVLEYLEVFVESFFPFTHHLHFLFLYLGGGVTSAAFALIRFRHQKETISVGASAGVAAILFASILFAPWELIYIFGLIPLPGVIMGVIYLFYSWKMAGHNDGIDHMAHFYGALFGLIYPICVHPAIILHFITELFTWSW